MSPDSHPQGPLTQLKSVADAIPALVAYITREHTYAVANRAYMEWLEIDPVGRTVSEVLGADAYQRILPHLNQALAGTRTVFDALLPYRTGPRYVEATYVPDLRPDGSIPGVIVFVTDIGERKRLETELRDQAASSATLARVGQALSREFDLQHLVQTLTDGATALAGAQFGAFFYKVLEGGGESYTLYTISGVAREAFSRFPMPRNTPIFEPTFRGARVVRFDDVTLAGEYGNNPPYRGMPEGHLPVRSYLAVPVISATGDVLGGLFFGHERPGVFTEWTESVISALAAQAGVAIDNSRLVAALRRERTQAEETARQYRFLSEIIPQQLWTADASGATDYVNARWVEFSGRDLADAVGTGWHSAVHPADLPRTLHAWAEAVSGGGLFEMTVRMQAADGRYRWFLSRAHPLRDHDGRILQWFGSCTDIHDQKRHEDTERLLSEASRVLAMSLELETTLSTVAALVAAWFRGYCIIDLLSDGRLQRVASAHVDPAKQPLMDEIRSYPPGDDHDNSIWRVLDSGRPEVCNAITEQVLKAATQSERHAEIRGLLGTTGYVIAPLIATGRAVGTIMLAATDGEIFEEGDVRPVEELAYRIAIAVTNARAYQEAREANRLKDEFLAVVSHELRTPLNAMRGWIALLKSKRLDPGQERQAIDIIDRNIDAQARLVDELLDIARIISGKMRLTIQQIDLASIISAAIDAVAPAASAKGIRITTAFRPAIGSVPGDPDRLQQIAWNLLSNAIKFTPRDGQVRVSLDVVDRHVELAVSDTGQGISRDFLPHVFDRFRQADSTTTRPVGGLGLGLAIVRHLVELHGGTVSASSEGEGRGATFVVSLPMLRSS